MNGRTSVGLVPGRIPGNTRSSSAPHRTRQSEVQGGRVEQAGHTMQQDPGPSTRVVGVCCKGAAETQLPPEADMSGHGLNWSGFCLCWMSYYECVCCLEQQSIQAY